MEKEKKEDTVILISKEELEKLENATMRVRVLGEILHNLFTNSFSDRAVVFLGNEAKMHDFIISSYDLTSGILWEAANTIEEQADQIDNILTELKHAF